MTPKRRHLRAPVALVMVVTAALVGLHPAWADEPVLVIAGRGWGHGVGMSQEGARTMGAAGASSEQILSTFYPGTELGSSGATVRVVVLESGQLSESLVFPGGGEIRATPSGRQPTGFPVVVAPGGGVEILRDNAGYRVSVPGPRQTAAGATRAMRLIGADNPAPSTVRTLPVTTGPTPSVVAPTTTTTMTTIPAVRAAPTSTTLPPPAAPTTSPPAVATTTTSTTTATPVATGRAAPGPLWAVPRTGASTVVSSRGRRYRGAIEVGSDGGGHLRMVNHVDVESYLRGMGEVLDPGWPPAALRAQTIAARTYALRAAATGAELCDDDRCQVYLGQGVEYAAMDKAVADSRGQVLLFDRRLAATFYSANAGGVTATAEEGFGSGDGAYPYLVSTPYPSADPYLWTERVRLADAGRRLSYPGTVTGARVTATGPSGRASEVTLDGDAGPTRVDGRTFASRLGLKSTLLAMQVEIGHAPALPEAPDTVLVSQDPGRQGPIELPPAARASAIAIPSSRAPTSWAGRRVTVLLALLAADVAFMAARARRRSSRPEPVPGARQA